MKKKSEVWLEEEPADVGDARTMRHHLLLPMGSVMSPRELCLAYSKVGGADSSKPFKVLDIGHNLLFALVDFGLALVRYFLPLGTGKYIICAIAYWNFDTCFLILQGFTVKNLPYVSKDTFDFETLLKLRYCRDF